jgi:hypothetical protein
MPPIPEDAVVIADYMLMADFVKQTDAEDTQISKGVRYCNGSRDHFYGGAGAPATNAGNPGPAQYGLTGGSSSTGGVGTNGIWKLPFFGTTGVSLMEGSHVAHSITLGGSAATETALDSSTNSKNDGMTIAETVTLGQTNIETSLIPGSYHFFGHFVASPIHTSSHYQTFETPFLHELVGGDRNMEQTNLVVTPDGKTWDEVTRDVSYIGEVCVSASQDTDQAASWTAIDLTEWRGTINTEDNLYNKDFAIAYDRLICLKTGWYNIHYSTVSSASGASAFVGIWLYINSTRIEADYNQAALAGGWQASVSINHNVFLNRGDTTYISCYNGEGNDLDESNYQITRI